jgi:hypothetical protein
MTNDNRVPWRIVHGDCLEEMTRLRLLIPSPFIPSPLGTLP